MVQLTEHWVTRCEVPRFFAENFFSSSFSFDSFNLINYEFFLSALLLINLICIFLTTVFVWSSAFIFTALFFRYEFMILDIEMNGTDNLLWLLALNAAYLTGDDCTLDVNIVIISIIIVVVFLDFHSIFQLNFSFKETENSSGHRHRWYFLLF